MTRAARRVVAVCIVAVGATIAAAIHALSARTGQVATAPLFETGPKTPITSGPQSPLRFAGEAQPVSTVAGSAAQSSAEPSSGEAFLMARLRAIESTDPALALQLAHEGNRRFPGSTDAPERAAIAIHALAAQGLPSEARREAEDMVNRYPDSTWVREVERFTGAHRHRNLRLNARGELESY